VRGRTLGTLTVANSKGGAPLRETEVQLVETFAEQAAVALEYARLQGKLQRLAVLEDRERIATELHDGAIQALERLCEEFQERTGVVAIAEIDP
jgi:nitrate/nitrite-specific signal transduction histidine kinase